MLSQLKWNDAGAAEWLLRGKVEHRIGDLEAAERHLIKASALPGGQPEAAYRLAQLYRSSGNFDKAATWYLATLTSDPEPFVIHNELQFTRCSDKLLPELVSFYQGLSELQPHRAIVAQFHAHYLSKQGEITRSIAESRRGARLEIKNFQDKLSPPEDEPTPPDFLILGTPKGGTTATLRWLDHVPNIWCHPRKELHFFDGRFEFGSEWYFAQFPRFQNDANIMRGEATPNYFSNPDTPERVAQLMPKAKLVVLLRNPVARAVSWVQHLQRLEGLDGSVAHWLEQELDQLELLNAKQLANHPRIGTGALQDSCYDLHWQRWRHALPANAPLLLSSDRLFKNPGEELNRLLEFLGKKGDARPWLEHWRPLNVNPSASEALPVDLHQRLEHFLQAQCQQTLVLANHPKT
ncbi:sulfotransferase domain-containing protein [Synechococcus sp. MIT S9509]|uniref:sulfotransferase domain-containing protein n=1 Tax=Synechococcus sp. MIT S9509 TaxID=1801630 RepID=UPI0039B09F6C